MNYFKTMLKMLERPVFLAYIDAGTGSLIIQMIIAGFAGGLLALKIFWKKIIHIFKQDKSGIETKKDEGETVD